MTKEQLKLRMMIITALFAAIIGILAQITIPFPLVPITGQTLAIGLAATILGSRFGTLSVIVYLAIGLAGVPVFAQFSSGFSTLFGPTGGYLIGFIPAAYFIGWYLEKTSFHFGHALISNIIGMILTLLIGTAWLKVAAHLSWTGAFTGGFAPFLIVGFIKAVISAWIGITVRKRLISAKLLISSKLDMKHTG